MRTSHLLFSAIHFFIVCAFFSVGIFLVGIAKAPLFQMILIDFIQNHAVLIHWIGIATLIAGGILLAGFLVMNRGQYYQITMQKGGEATVDLTLLKKIIAQYWQKHFSDGDDAIDVSIDQKQRIVIRVPVAHLSPDELEKLFKQVEIELGDILANKLAYRREFILSAVVE